MTRLSSLPFLSFPLILYLLQLSTSSSQISRKVPQTNKIAEDLKILGTKFANTTVWAALIQTDASVAGIMGRDFNRIPQGVNGTANQNAWIRVDHAREMTANLPFHVDLWWSVYSRNCPGKNNKGNDRGVALAHHQIWADFDLQGRHKNGRHRSIASDRDVLIVFEDDAVIAVRNVTASLEREISRMSTDLLFLGWCYGRRVMPMCGHAYALTRAGVRKILSEWDNCSQAGMDGQWKVTMHLFCSIL